ncbi:MAG: methyltransferase domain-containing protein [Candidatus Hydrogenedentota bacterium]
MKRVVMDSGLHDSIIRPQSLLSEFRRRSIEDAKAFFSDASLLVDVPCPACESSEGNDAFEKEGFTYHQCADCESLYVSPRPSHEALAEYYQKAKATTFRVEHFQRETAEARRKHLLRSFSNWLGRIVDEQGSSDARSFIDIGTNSAVLFDEIQHLDLFDTFYALNPLPGLTEELEALNVQTVSESLLNARAITALQQIENQFSPFDFLKTAGDMLAINGLLFFTTRTISGFDLQMLWGKTPYIFVPEHLNLLSLEGIDHLVHRAGLDIIELSTPGQLDLELTAQAAKADSTIKLPHFVEYLIHQRDELAHSDFQAFLQKHRLSSHVRVAAFRPKGVDV